MSNVHQIFRSATVPIAHAHAHVKVSPAKRPFKVSITIGGEVQELNVLAYTSCDAICNAIDIFFDGDEPMPVDSLRIEATSMILRAA